MTIYIKCDGCSKTIDSYYKHIKISWQENPFNFPDRMEPTCDVYIPDENYEDKYFCNMNCLKIHLEYK